MSKHRRCDRKCHGAARARCSCWCGGLFHGERGAVARDVFVAMYGAPIPAECPLLAEPLLHWSQVGSRFTEALEAARAAAQTREVAA